MGKLLKTATGKLPIGHKLRCCKRHELAQKYFGGEHEKRQAYNTLFFNETYLVTNIKFLVMQNNSAQLIVKEKVKTDSTTPPNTLDVMISLFGIPGEYSYENFFSFYPEDMNLPTEHELTEFSPYTEFLENINVKGLLHTDNSILTNYFKQLPFKQKDHQREHGEKIRSKEALVYNLSEIDETFTYLQTLQGPPQHNRFHSLQEILQHHQEIILPCAQERAEAIIKPQEYNTPPNHLPQLSKENYMKISDFLTYATHKYNATTYGDVRQLIAQRQIPSVTMEFFKGEKYLLATPDLQNLAQKTYPKSRR